MSVVGKNIIFHNELYNTSHNILLLFAAETGIIGLIFYFGTLIYLIINFLKTFVDIRTKNKSIFFKLV